MQHNVPVLLVDDSKIDTQNVQRAFTKSTIDNPLFVAHNGEDAVHFLQRSGCFQEVPLPGLIILDINMPIMNGLEFLSFVKTHPEYHHIPVVVLTSSLDRTDRLACYRLGVAGYFNKPLAFPDFVVNIRIILDYWNRNALP
jgi:CheY-like chemotaxis protein